MITRRIGSFFCILTLLAIAGSAQSMAPFSKLQEVTQLPVEVPQRVGALAFDGKKLWFAIYHGRGAYVTYDPVSEEWETKGSNQLRSSIAAITGRFQSPGGIAFADGKLWTSSSYGESFGSVELTDPSKISVYERFHNNALIGTTSQSYSDLTYDGTHLWAAWHAFYYKNDGTRTQLLLKIDKDTGEVLDEFPLAERNRADGTHGLAWDGRSLWHVKGNWLTEFDRDGKKRNEFRMDKLNRPSGMAWDGRSLWIAEFGGKLWRLQFKAL